MASVAPFFKWTGLPSFLWNGFEISVRTQEEEDDGIESIRSYLETGLDVLQLGVALGNLTLASPGDGRGQLTGALSGNLQGKEQEFIT